MMTLAERDSLEALRRRLRYAEGICHCVTSVSTDEHTEAVRGVGMMLEDGITHLDMLINAANAAAKGGAE